MEKEERKPNSAGEITALLQDAQHNAEMMNLAYAAVKDRLAQIASARMQSESPHHSLQTTVLVNDAFLKLVGKEQWSCREDFFALAARVMRNMLIDHARQKLAQKRGGGQEHLVIAAASQMIDKQNDPEQLIALDDALCHLEKSHPEAFNVFSLHYFMEWTLKEIASVVLEIPYARVLRLWSTAKQELRRIYSHEKT